MFKSDKGNRKDTNTHLSGGVGTGLIFFNNKTKISGEGNIYNKHSDNLLSQIITNTVITDYLKISDDENN